MTSPELWQWSAVDLAAATGREWAPDPAFAGFDAARTAMLDRLADAVVDHLDTAAVTGLIGL